MSPNQSSIILIIRNIKRGKLEIFSINNVLASSVMFCFFLTCCLQPLRSQQRKADSLIMLLRNSREDTVRIRTLYNLSDYYLDKDPHKAIFYANKGLLLSNKILYEKGSSICLNALGLSYMQLAEYDSALICFKRRNQLSVRIKDKHGEAASYDNISIIYIHFGKVDSALYLRIKSNKIYTDLNEKNHLANGNQWIGNIYKEKGKYSKALEYYLKALRILESTRDSMNIGYPEVNISSVYRYMKQYKQAKNYALKAINIFEHTDNSDGVGAALYRLALIYTEENDNNKAIENLLKAQIIFEKTGNIYFQNLVNSLLGTCYYNKGESKNAISIFQKAIKTAIDNGDVTLILDISQNLGRIYYDKGNYSKALEYFYKSDSLSNLNQDNRALMELSTNFIEIYSRLNKPDSVVKYFQRYRVLSDSLFSVQNSESIAEMQAKYDTEKKDRELKIQKLTIKIKNLEIKFSLFFGFMILTLLIIVTVLYRKRNKAYKQLVYENLALAGITPKINYKGSSDEDIESELPESEKQNHSGLDQEQKISILKNLNVLIQNKVYTNPGLTINELAEKCDTNRTYLSIVINETFKMNFNNFINKLRIDEAIRVLTNPNNNIPLKELYLNLGFNSYSTFHEAFKKFKIVTPAFFQKTVQETQKVSNSVIS